jgi:hypothetical protein
MLLAVSRRKQAKHLKGDIGGQQSHDLSWIIGRRYFNDIAGNEVGAA